MLLFKGTLDPILTFVVEFDSDKAEDKKTDREAEGSFHHEELIYRVFSSYLFCLTYAVISTKIVLGLIH